MTVRPIDEVIAAYRHAADPDRAADMARYMKGRFSFFGIAAPRRRAIDRDVTAGWAPPDEDALRTLLADAWTCDEREVQYFAIDRLGRFRTRLSPASLPALRDAIVTRSWWDTVDAIAARLVGDIVRRHRETQPLVAGWIDADDMWLRRAALLHQLGFGADADEELLFALCADRAHDTEFFIRKAIGWALRQHARVAPDEVRRFLVDHEDELAPLSRREAAKHL